MVGADREPPVEGPGCQVDVAGGGWRKWPPLVIGGARDIGVGAMGRPCCDHLDRLVIGVVYPDPG